MTCVTACNTATQIQITDLQLHNIPLCRSFTYYVNPLSTSPVELGTKQHPYKELQSVLTDLISFHTNSNRTITVYLMEDTTNFILTPSYISNITQVNFLTYSSKSTPPSSAKIVGVELESAVVPPAISSKFNILGRCLDLKS